MSVDSPSGWDNGKGNGKKTNGGASSPIMEVDNKGYSLVLLLTQFRAGAKLKLAQTSARTLE